MANSKFENLKIYLAVERRMKLRLKSSIMRVCFEFINPKKQKMVEFELLIDSKMRLFVEAGEFEIMIGSSSEDIKLKDVVELTENVRVSKKQKKFFSNVKIK